MPKLEGELTVYYTVELDDPGATPETAEDVLEAAYANGEMGIIDDHVWAHITLDGKVVVHREVEPDD